MSILEPKNERTRTLSLRIPFDLHAQVEALRADAEAAGLLFDVADVVSKSLSAAVKTGRAELSAICIQNADSADAQPAPSLDRSLAQAAQVTPRRDTSGANDRREGAVAGPAGA